MKQCRIPTIMMAISLSASVYGANPFLAAQDNKPVSAKFCGTEWGDKIQQDQIPLTARVVTTRVAKTSWGAIFKIEFTDLESNAPQKREIRPDYFIVTDDRIVLSNEEDNEAAVKKISALDKPPEFELGDIYGITMGKFSHEDGPLENGNQRKRRSLHLRFESSLGSFQKDRLEKRSRIG
jgi:hypothetical protein